MTALVFDSEAVSRLARRGREQDVVRAALQAAYEAGVEVRVPAAALAELYRGGRHDQVVDSYLGREPGLGIVPTDRALARTVGHLLAQAGRGSRDHVDATVVATAVAAGGGVIVTGDPDDLSPLSSGIPAVTVTGL